MQYFLKVRRDETKGEDMEDEEIEQAVDKKFQKIIAEGKIDREIIAKT